MNVFAFVFGFLPPVVAHDFSSKEGKKQFHLFSTFGGALGAQNDAKADAK